MGPLIQNESDLQNYILTKLGQGVINIELTPDQLNWVVRDAIDKYIEIGISGAEERYIMLELQDGVFNYTLPYTVVAIRKIYTKIVPTILFNAQDMMLYQFLGNTEYRLFDLTQFALLNNLMDTIDYLFSNEINFNFNSITKELFILSEPGNVNIFNYAYLKVYMAIDPDDPTQTNIYNFRWVRLYATALARRQWAQNLQKYAGTNLPGGLQLNAEAILAQANEEIEKLEAELENKYRQPPALFFA